MKAHKNPIRVIRKHFFVDFEKSILHTPVYTSVRQKIIEDIKETAKNILACKTRFYVPIRGLFTHTT